MFPTPSLESQEIHTHRENVSSGKVEIVCHQQSRNFEEILRK